jgi:predicted phosphodiesterase
MMRIAVMSDIHGFDLALETVLADIDRRGPFDQVIVAGDLCLVGPQPGRVLEILSSRELHGILGNTDRDLVTAAGGEWGSDETDFALAQIGPAGVAYLASLPFARRVTPAGCDAPEHDLLVVHANPHDLETQLTSTMSDEELREIIGDVEAEAMAFGHRHEAYMRRLDGRLLVDVSAVGNPKDGDLRCAYGVLMWDAADAIWSGEIVRLEYPVQETLAEMRASAMPDVEGAIAALLCASYDE